MNLQTILIQQLVSALVVMMSPEVMNRVDDIVVLGICQQIRRAFDVPDND